jgi:hypothetical protein
MGQRTLTFTKQMLRVFNLVELEELDHLVANAFSAIPRSSETDPIYLQRTTSTNKHKQTYIYLYIYIYMYVYIYMHKNITPFKKT